MSLLVEFIYQGKRAQSVTVVDEREGNRKARERLWGQPAGATATVTRYVRGVAPKVISRWCVGHDRTIVVDSLVSIPRFADASLLRRGAFSPTGANALLSSVVTGAGPA
jgi:hypothetical protein